MPRAIVPSHDARELWHAPTRHPQVFVSSRLGGSWREGGGGVQDSTPLRSGERTQVRQDGRDTIQHTPCDIDGGRLPRRRRAIYIAARARSSARSSIVHRAQQFGSGYYSLHIAYAPPRTTRRRKRSRHVSPDDATYDAARLGRSQASKPPPRAKISGTHTTGGPPREHGAGTDLARLFAPRFC
jgi:hypothetical protein